MAITCGWCARRRLLDLRRCRQAWGYAVSVIGGLLVGWALGKTAEYYTSDLQAGQGHRSADRNRTGDHRLKGISIGMQSSQLRSHRSWPVSARLLGRQQHSTGEIGGSTASPLPPSACSPPPASSCRSTPTARSQTTPAASPRWPSSDPSVREVTDALDSLGNTTAAIGKGFAVGSAALTALALFKSFEFASTAADECTEPRPR